MPVVHSVQSDLSNVSSVREEWTRKISFPANAALRTNYSRASVLLPYYSTSIYLRQLMILSADKNSLVLYIAMYNKKFGEKGIKIVKVIQLCWNHILFILYRSSHFQQTLNNFVSFHFFFTKLSEIILVKNALIC